MLYQSCMQHGYSVSKRPSGLNTEAMKYQEEHLHMCSIKSTKAKRVHEGPLINRIKSWIVTGFLVPQ
jgi:hypothetical protein